MASRERKIDNVTLYKLLRVLVIVMILGLLSGLLLRKKDPAPKPTHNTERNVQ
jgi:hypothetical protein